MSQLPPLTREKLRGLKAQKQEQFRVEQEKQRLHQVSRTVHQIYGGAVNVAETKGETSYKQILNNSDPFILANMPDILDGLRFFFPDCTIEHALLVKGNDGLLYDISKMDEKMRPFINMQQGQNYLVIDWS